MVSSTTAVRIPKRMEGTTPRCHFDIPVAVTIDTNEASIPTERSIPPEIITIVMPTATIPGTPTCCRMFSRFTGLIKVGYLVPPVVINCRRTMTTTNPKKIDNTVKFSCRWKRVFLSGGWFIFHCVQSNRSECSLRKCFAAQLSHSLSILHHNYPITHGD